MLSASPQEVRRLAIRNQRLAGPAPRGKANADALFETAQALRCLQLDPTSIVAKSHLLVLFSRHGAFDEREFAKLAYEQKRLFEYWAHEASLVLADDLPIHAYEMRTWPRGSGQWTERVMTWWDENQPWREYIHERLATEGLTPARDIEDRSTRPWVSTGGWHHGRSTSRILDFMWLRGQIGIGARDGNTRLWDLMERCLPPDPPAETLSAEEVTRRAVPLAIKALGAGRATHINKHFIRGRYPELPKVLEDLKDQGEIERLRVDGLGDDWWIHSDDVDVLKQDDFKPRTVLLSPFDNLLCDRDRTEALFGFRHRLEIYVPKPKRVWGFFVLPILDGDRLVARADLALDRDSGTLIAHAVHAEPKHPRGKRLPQAIRRELARLAAWRGATNLEVRNASDAWRPILAA